MHVLALPVTILDSFCCVLTHVLALPLMHVLALPLMHVLALPLMHVLALPLTVFGFVLLRPAAVPTTQ